MVISGSAQASPRLDRAAKQLIRAQDDIASLSHVRQEWHARGQGHLWTTAMSIYQRRAAEAAAEVRAASREAQGRGWRS
jgi:hypothetical protein